MTAASDSAGITMVPLAGLAPHPLNPRPSLGDLAELAASIAAQGLFEPLVVLSAAAHAEASKARDVACIAIASGPLPSACDLAQLLTAALLGAGGGRSESLWLACRWLAVSGAVPSGADHYQWRDQLTACGDHRALQRYAYAYALAGDELRVRSRWASWGEHHAADLARLARAAGYVPGAWEQDRLAEAQACADAHGSLACPHCGCTGAGGCGSGCRIGYDRDQGQVAYECGWDCSRHRAAGRAAGTADRRTG